MDDKRFDDITRMLGAERSRRRVVRGLVGGIAGAMVAAVGRVAPAAQADAGTCVEFCRQIPPGPERGACVSDAARGEGPCYECGPAAPQPPTATLCGGACVDVASDPGNCGGCGTTCDAGEPCINGTCGCPEYTAYCESSSTCVSTFCNYRKVYNPETCACECDAQYVTLPAGGCGIPCQSDADCPGTCDTTTEGQKVCNCGNLVHCTNCTDSFDCSNGCSAINVYCDANDRSCGVVC